MPRHEGGTFSVRMFVLTLRMYTRNLRGGSTIFQEEGVKLRERHFCQKLHKNEKRMHSNRMYTTRRHRHPREQTTQYPGRYSLDRPVADLVGVLRGPCPPPSPVQISHKKVGRQRRPHGFHGIHTLSAPLHAGIHNMYNTITTRNMYNKNKHEKQKKQNKTCL